MDIVEKLIRWIIFSVVIALLPILVNWVFLWLRRKATTFENLTGRGELLLIAAAMAASAIGEVIPIGQTAIVPTGHFIAIAKFIAVGLCVAIVLISSVCFGDISSALISNQYRDPHRVSILSVCLYCSALISSAACIVFSEV